VWRTGDVRIIPQIRRQEVSPGQKRVLKEGGDRLETKTTGDEDGRKGYNNQHLNETHYAEKSRLRGWRRGNK